MLVLPNDAFIPNFKTFIVSFHFFDNSFWGNFTHFLISNLRIHYILQFKLFIFITG